MAKEETNVHQLCVRIPDSLRRRIDDYNDKRRRGLAALPRLNISKVARESLERFLDNATKQKEKRSQDRWS